MHLMYPKLMESTPVPQSISEGLTWTGIEHGVQTELITASHMFNTSLSGTWTTCGPHSVDRSLSSNVTEMSMYIRHPPNHFDVCSVI